jgi:hypothetical protein
MAKETMESEFHTFEEAFKIKKIIDLLYKIKKYDSLDQAFVKEILGIDKASTKEEMKKILLDFDSAEIDKALKKLTVAEKSINERIYTELKDPKHSQKMIQGENGMITVDKFLKTYDNYEKFSENYLVSEDQKKDFYDFSGPGRFVNDFNDTDWEILNLFNYGFIKNKPQVDKFYKIHSDINYNRFAYFGKYYINREQLIEYNEAFVLALDNICFKGKTHLKRGIGFTTVPEKLMDLKKLDGIFIRKEIKDIFIRHYKCELLQEKEETAESLLEE